MADHELIARRRVLVAAIDDVTAVARQESALGRLPDEYLMEVARLMIRLQLIQKEIEAHDVD